MHTTKSTRPEQNSNLRPLRRLPAPHQRQRDLERGSSTDRGYGSDHGELRDQWARRVATGTVRCARPDCGELIHPDEAWDLGHDEQRNYRGPEHQGCNRTTRGPLREPRNPNPYAPPPDPPLVIPF
jgi:hypothetical protein